MPTPNRSERTTATRRGELLNMGKPLGRPMKLADERKSKRSISLQLHLVEYASLEGSGNVSAGIEKAHCWLANLEPGSVPVLSHTMQRWRFRGELAKKLSVSLNPEALDALTQLGGGRLSHGVSFVLSSKARAENWKLESEPSSASVGFDDAPKHEEPMCGGEPEEAKRFCSFVALQMLRPAMKRAVDESKELGVGKRAAVRLLKEMFDEAA